VKNAKNTLRKLCAQLAAACGGKTTWCEFSHATKFITEYDERAILLMKAFFGDFNEGRPCSTIEVTCSFDDRT
jgi:hypothetical protein